MSKQPQHTIYTIGHSTRSMEEFIAMLQSFNIKILADIRSLSGSRKFPQFNKENLQISIPEAEIAYIHLTDLGGRRKVNKNSRNIRWHNDAFKSYADYMETEPFAQAILNLENIAAMQPTCYMCAEAVWWRCHRSMVSDYLKAKGWNVLHIMANGKIQEHQYTQPARVVGDNVYYFD